MVSANTYARPVDSDRRQAWWGTRYVSAICAQAGYMFAETPPEGDVHSLDGQVIMRPGLGVSVQVKCSQKPITRSRSWTIKQSWRNNWEHLDLPGYFVQVSVPTITTDWVEHPTDARWTTLMRCAAFWTRIDPLSAGQKTITVSTARRMTVDTLDIWAADLEAAMTGFSGGGTP